MLSLGFGVIGADPAIAATAPPDDLSQKAQTADAEGFMVVEPNDGVSVGGATFYPTGEIADSTLVVIANDDGSLPAGVSDSIAARSGGTVAPRYTLWPWSSTSAGYSGAYTGGSLIGLNDSTTATYTFNTSQGFNERASGQGLGFYRGYYGSQFGVWEKWYYVGNTGFAETGAAVPWGNVAATKKFKAICTITLTCFGNWY